LKIETVKNEVFTPAPIYIVAAKLEKTHKTTPAGFQNVQPKCKLVRGFTLFEALLALVVLMIAAAGLILPFASSATVQEQGCSQTIATKLACDRVEQIISDDNDFSQIVASYNYTEQKGEVKDANGVNFTGSMYADFSRETVCEGVYMSQQDSSFGTPKFIRITVRVYQNGLELAEVTRLKSK
jgi:type II secretory pathway pseudopilin PulG